MGRQLYVGESDKRKQEEGIEKADNVFTFVSVCVYIFTSSLSSSFTAAFEPL